MANVDMFLKIDGIEGESMDSKHAKEIDVISFSWGAKQAGSMATGMGGGTGKVQMADFSFTMLVNKATPKLILACANGSHIKSAVLTVRKAGKDQQEFLKITFGDFLVSSYTTHGGYESSVYGGKTELPVPTDVCSFNYSTIKHEYAAQKQDGTLDGFVTAGWNLKTNIPL